MKSANVLKMLQEISAKEVDMAAEDLAKAMKAVNEAKVKHTMLLEYRQDYEKNLKKVSETGMGAEAFQNFQNFFAKLDQAIAGQQEVVEMAEQNVKVSRHLWQESQRKKLSYDVLLNRSDKREFKAEQKKDQKMMDEFAMRATRIRH